MAKDTVIELAKTSRKALKAVRHRLDSLQDVQQHQGDQLARIERTIGTTEARQTAGLAGVFAGIAEGIVGPKSIMGELGAIRNVQENHQGATLNLLKEIRASVRPDTATAAGVLAKLDRVVPELQGINSGFSKVRTEVFEQRESIKGLTRNLSSLGTYVQETWEMAKALRADVGTVRSTVAILEDNQSSTQMRPALAEVRDALTQLRTDLVDVAAELSDDLSTQIASASGQRQGSGDAVTRGRVEHGIELTVQLAKALETLRDEQRHIGMTTRNKVESWLSLLGKQGDLLQSQYTQLGVMADRLKTLLDRQERAHDTTITALATVSRDMTSQHLAVMRELGKDGECESRHASIIAYLKALESKIDALSVEVSEMRQAQEES